MMRKYNEHVNENKLGPGSYFAEQQQTKGIKKSFGYKGVEGDLEKARNRLKEGRPEFIEL